MKFILTFLFTLSMGVCFAQSPKDDFTGRWLSEDNEVLTMKKEGGYFVGYNNKGFKVMYDIHYEDGEWIGRGKDPVTKLSGDCELSFDGARLKVRGGLGFIKTSHYFTRL